MWRNLVRGGLLVSLGVFLSRVAGFLRELALAHRLGLGRSADLAVFTLTVPDIVAALLVGGAISATLVPEFKIHLERDPGKLRPLLAQSTIASFLLFGLAAGVVALASGPFASLLAPGLAAGSGPEAARLVSISVLGLPFLATAAVWIACLQALGRFGISSVGPVLYNGVIIATILLWTRPGVIAPLAIGVIAAYAIHGMAQGVNLAVALPRVPSTTGRALTSELVFRYLHSIGSVGLLVLVPVTARALASLDSSGSLAAVNYALKTVDLPMGVAVGVLSVVLLPSFTQLFLQGKHGESVTLARQATWLIWTLSVPIALSIAWFTEPLIRLLFVRGAMDPADALRIASLTTWAIVALPAMGLSSIFFALLSAARDTRRPFRIGGALFLAYVALAVAGRRTLGLHGIIGAGVALHWAVAIAYGWILSRHHEIEILGGGLLRDLLLSAAASAAVLAPVALLAGRSHPPLSGTLLALGAGAASLAAALFLFRYRTLPDGIRTLFRKVSPGSSEAQR